MNVSLQMISGLLKAGPAGLLVLSERNITPEILTGEASIALKLIFEHIEKYKTLPSKEAIEAQTSITLPNSEDTLEFLADATVQATLKIKAMEILQDNIGPLQNSDTLKAITKIEDDLRELKQKLNKKSSGAISIYKLIPEIEEKYELMKSGKRGIPYPFKTINRASLGIWPQDFAVFVGRLGQGKSWMALLCALSAEAAGAKVLIATTEMARVRMAERYLAMKLKLSYGRFRAGTLDMFSEDAMKSHFKQLYEKDDERVQIVGGEFLFSPDNLNREIDKHQPHVVIVDGAYLLDMDGEGGREKAENIFNYLKQTATKTHCGLIATMQFNRSAKRDDPDTISDENIGLTDRAGWNADLLYGLYQTKDMKLETKMGVKAMKVREGSPEDFECIWDISKMHFEEIPDPAREWDPFYTPPANNLIIDGGLSF